MSSSFDCEAYEGSPGGSADAVPYPSKWTILFRSLLWPHIPMSILKYVKYIPTKDHIRFRRTLDIMHNFAKSLIEEKTEAILSGKGENPKDIMSILGMLQLWV